MTKPKSKPKAAARSTARKTAKPMARKRLATASSRPDARIIAMLRKPAGATIAAIGHSPANGALLCGLEAAEARFGFSPAGSVAWVGSRWCGGSRRANLLRIP
jgi:hypothetical protein